MKKTASMILIIVMTIFLVMPVPGEAGGRYGGHWSGGGHSGWWVPLAIFGGAAVLGSYIYATQNPPPPVVIREQPPVYVQPAPPLAPSPNERVFVYPRLGQNEEQQASDRYACHNWAAGQTGYNPTQSPASDITPSQLNQMRSNYLRAQGACLDARGYTMR